jgi:uncharacterized GH25 family protein
MRIACAVALFLLAAVAIPAAGPTTKLNIVVKSQGGHPVDRASVIVKCLDRSVSKLGKHECPAYEIRTNEEGLVKLPPIPQGKIRIQVIAKGYQTFGQDYTVTDEEKTVDIKLNPPQQQYSAHQ